MKLKIYAYEGNTDSFEKNVVIICNDEFCYSSLCVRGGSNFDLYHWN